MPSKRCVSLWAAAGIAGLFCVTFALRADDSGDSPQPSPEGGSEVAQRVTIETARDRAKLMHEIYASTLDVMHHRYFHSNRSVVPARALEDVFAEMARQSKGQARWISVNTKPMSIDNKPRNEFEKKAAKQLAAGKEDFELVEQGVYHRAAPIPLTAGCIGCHTGLMAPTSKSPRLAGLVISIPVSEE
jgi:hypothetical protein